jgi:hypothetical protein
LIADVERLTGDAEMDRLLLETTDRFAFGA